LPFLHSRSNLWSINAHFIQSPVVIGAHDAHKTLPFDLYSLFYTDQG